MPSQSFTPESFQTFGDLLKYLRRHERLTQLELSIAVGYSEAQIGRLEKNQRRPDLTALKALFIPALHLDNNPKLAERFLELAQSARQEDVPTPGIAPYKGLLFFDMSDSDLFFGREALTTHLAERVIGLAVDTSTRLLAIVGASGSGKSSLVRAGLAVILKRAGWDVSIFTPGMNPLKALEMHLDLDQIKAEPNRVLILVDQFEEVFTLCRDESERRTFIRKLLSLSQSPSKKTMVVIALRADFYSHCAQYPPLRHAVAAEQEYIGQMTSEELRRAIEEPARQGGWEFEPGLVDILLQDIGVEGTGQPEPGALPLLSHALLATWEQRRGRTFTLDGYRASGSVRGAIAETAESVFTDQLNKEQQELARNVFLRLTELGEGTEDTRRRAALNELVRQSAEAAQLREVLNTLAEARLITLNEDNAEVAHEALIREWQRLHEWLTQDREGLRLHRHLTDSAHEWEILGHDAGALYRGARLAQAQEWASVNDQRLNESEHAFLTASIEQEQYEILEREAQRQRELENAQKLAETQRQSASRLRISNRVITAVASVAVILAMLAGMLGLQSNRNAVAAQNNAATAQAEAEISATQKAIAEENFVKAENQRLAAEANRIVSDPTGNSELATLLSVYSMRNGYMDNADVALAKGTLNLYTQFIIHPEKATAGAAVFSPDGTIIATGASGQTIQLWDAKTGEFLRTFSKGTDGTYSGIPSLKFSRDGKWLFTRNNIGGMRLINFKTGEIAQTYEFNAEHQATQMDVSPDGKMILGVGARVIELWETLSGKKINTYYAPDEVFDAAFSPDSRSVIVGLINGEAYLLDASDGEKLLEYKHNSPRSVVSFSPNGQFIAIGQDNGEIYLHRTDTPELVKTFRGHQNAVLSVAFSPDGQLLISSSRDTTVRLWDVATGEQLNVFSGHTHSVVKVEFSPNGTSALSSAEDGEVRVWRIRTTTLNEHDPNARFVPNVRVTWSPEGRVMLVEKYNEIKQTAILNFIETDTSKVFYSMEIPKLVYRRLSPEGKYILLNMGSDELYTTQVWDIYAGKLVLEFNNNWAITDAVFSPDNTQFIVGESTGTRLYLWEIQSGNSTILNYLGVRRTTVANANSEPFAWSPDGRYIAIGSKSGQTNIIATKTHSREKFFGIPFTPPATWITAVGFSVNGDKIVTGETGGKIRLWDFASGKTLREFNGHTGDILSVKLSHDSRFVLSASNDKTVRLWDANTGKLIRVFHHTAPVNYAAFSLDGKFIVSSGDDGGRLWDVDYRDTIQAACALLIRDFTPDERTLYGITDTIPTCHP